MNYIAWRVGKICSEKTVVSVESSMFPPNWNSASGTGTGNALKRIGDGRLSISMILPSFLFSVDFHEGPERGGRVQKRGRRVLSCPPGE